MTAADWSVPGLRRLSVALLLLLCLLELAPGFAKVRASSLVSAKRWATPREVEQFELLSRASLGEWKGIQTGYDPQDDLVADFMYTEVVYTQEGEELVHVNGVVMGEIRADCEVCYDSERLRQKEVGRYQAGKLPNIRAVHNTVLRGPAPTRRGMSAELHLFHPEATPGAADQRIRVLLAYQPIDFQDIAGVGSVPSAMGLSDVIIVRERRGTRPLKLDDKPDEMWRPETTSTMPVLGQRHRFKPDGLVEKMAGQSLQHEPLSLALPDTQQPTDDDVYSRSFPGGIRIEAGAVVYAGLETRIRVTWQPSLLQPQSTYRSEVAFAALESVQVDPAGALRVSPPRLVDFNADF